MRINFERIIDKMIECNGCTADYCKSSRDYYKSHGYGLNLDRATTGTQEEKHIVYAYHASDRADSEMRTMIEVLDLSREETARLMTAARAAERWYNRTRWERLIPTDLLNRLERFVFE